VLGGGFIQRAAAKGASASGAPRRALAEVLRG
jgi:hypothetical protein